MPGITLFGSVALLTLAAPFERTRPLVRVAAQSITSVEAALLVAFVASAVAFGASRRLPVWRTPLTLPWIALVLAMTVASAASAVSRVNALHMTGRIAMALGVYLLVVNALTTRARVRATLRLALAAGAVVSVLVVLEYAGNGPVLTWLTAFRPGIATVGAQVRGGGPLQYPTIASMYLEIVFALGLGLLIAERAAPARRSVMRITILFVALLLIGQAITLTFTRAGLITMAASLLTVGALDRASRHDTVATWLVGGLAIAIAGLFLSSRSSQSMWLRLTSEGQEAWYRAAIDAPPIVSIPAGRRVTVPLVVTNTGRLVWDSSATPPILVSYHWRPVGANGYVTFEGLRAALPSPVAPGSSATVLVSVRAPRQPGRYRLEWDLVEEGQLWFSTEPGAVHSMSQGVVSGAASAGDEDGPLVPLPRRTVRPGRLVLWRAAIRMFAAHPIVGVGPDNFRLAYGSYARLADTDVRTHSNNMYLEMLAGGGVVVFAAFGWLLWRAAECVNGLRRAPVGESAALAAGVAAALLAIALHATVDSFISFTPIYVLFALTLGCAVACVRGLEVPSNADRI